MVLFPLVFLKAQIHHQVRYLYLFRCHFNYAVYLVYYSLFFFLFTLTSRDMRYLRARHARIRCGRKSHVNSIRHRFSDETNCFLSFLIETKTPTHFHYCFRFLWNNVVSQSLLALPTVPAQVYVITKFLKCLFFFCVI